MPGIGGRERYADQMQDYGSNIPWNPIPIRQPESCFSLAPETYGYTVQAILPHSTALEWIVLNRGRFETRIHSIIKGLGFRSFQIKRTALVPASGNWCRGHDTKPLTQSFAFRPKQRKEIMLDICLLDIAPRIVRTLPHGKSSCGQPKFQRQVIIRNALFERPDSRRRVCLI